MITYTTNPNDLSEPGKYIMHAHVEWGASRKLFGDPDVLIVRPIGKGAKATFEVNEMGQHKFDLHRFTSPDELFTVYLYRIDQSVQELKKDINYKIERRYDRYITIISPTLEKGDRIEVIYR